MGIRVTLVRDATWMLAEPVPVRRPGVCMIGVDDRLCEGVSGTDSGTGRTKVGLNLYEVSPTRERRKPMACPPQRKPDKLNPRGPIRYDDVSAFRFPCLWEFCSSPGKK